MKNPYVKFIKYLEKQDKVMFQRSGDFVYLCDGVIMLKVPAMIYTEMIRPLSGILPDGLTDCSGVKDYNDLIIQISENACNLEKMHERFSTEEKVIKTPFSVSFTPKSGRKEITARIFTSNNEIICVNEALLDVVKDCLNGVPWMSSGKKTSPLVQKDELFTIVVCPIRVDSEIFEMWRGAKW